MQPPSGGRPFVFVLTRAARWADAPRDGFGPRRDACLGSLHSSVGWLSAIAGSTQNAANTLPQVGGRKSAHRDAQPWLQKARRAPLSPAIAPAHTALRSRQRPPPAERRAGLSLSHPALASSQAAHPQPAPGCVAHTHTHRGGGSSWRARRYAAARHAFLRSGRTGGVSARPRPPTAHNCMAHPVPHTTRQRHPRRPAPRGLHNWAFAPGHRCPRTDQPRSSG